MKKIAVILFLLFITFSNFYTYASFPAEDVINKNSKILSIREKIDRDIAVKKEKYGETFGIVSYILDTGRVLSIPVGFVGLAISGTLTYVVNAREIAARQRGWRMMIAWIAFIAIWQILPLAFALVAMSWR